MKKVLPDIKILEAIRPEEIASYLQGNGWVEIEKFHQKISIWNIKNKKGRELEVLLPLHPDFTDYARRLGELFETLESFEGRSWMEIFRDLKNWNVDALHFLFADTERGRGLPLEGCERFLQGMREMLQAAASATLNPQGCFDKYEIQAERYSREARLMELEDWLGYAFMVTCPVPEVSEFQGKSFTETLAKTLVVLQGLPEDPVKIVEEGVHNGVSAKLCQALVKVLESGGGKELKISFSWSRSRANFENHVREVSFSSNMIQRIWELSMILSKSVQNKARRRKDEVDGIASQYGSLQFDESSVGYDSSHIN